MGHSDSLMRLPSCGSVSAGTNKRIAVNHTHTHVHAHSRCGRRAHLPSRIFCSSSSSVGSISSQPSGGGLRLRRTFGMLTAGWCLGGWGSRRRGQFATVRGVRRWRFTGRRTAFGCCVFLLGRVGVRGESECVYKRLLTSAAGRER